MHRIHQLSLVLTLLAAAPVACDYDQTIGEQQDSDGGDSAGTSGGAGSEAGSASSSSSSGSATGAGESSGTSDGEAESSSTGEAGTGGVEGGYRIKVDITSTVEDLSTFVIPFVSERPPSTCAEHQPAGRFCETYTCDSIPQVGPETDVDAGTITVELEGDIFNLDPDPLLGGYEYVELAGTLPVPAGTPISVSVEGSAELGIGPVDLSVPMASPILLTQPQPDAETLAVDRTESFEVTWTAGEVGTVVEVLLVTAETDGPNHVVQCDVPAEEGGVTIPTESMMTLVTDAEATLVLYPVTEERVEVDGTLYLAKTTAGGLATWYDGVNVQ